MGLEEFHSGQSVGEPNHYIRVFDRKGAEITYSIPKMEGTHGRSDALLVACLFRDGDLPDPLGQSSGSFDGAMSILIGVAANQSIASVQPVNIDDLFQN